MGPQNARYEAPVRAFLDGLLTDPSRHARFLNMLSMLEHRGSRKIMLSQMDNDMSEETLKHLAEETRHAFFFKRQAEKAAGQAMNGYTDANTMARVPALLYFGRLDAEITKRTAPHENPEVPYLFVSLIVELRACWIYHLYQEALAAGGATFSLKSVIAEENLHLDDMFAALDGFRALDAPLMQDLAGIETRLFGRLWGVLETGGIARAA